MASPAAATDPPCGESRLKLSFAIASLISVVILLIVAFAGSYIVTMLYAFDQRSDALHLPVWIPQSFLTGGLALTAILIVAAEITSRSR